MITDVKALFLAPDPTQRNYFELSRIGRYEHSYDATHLNSTQLSWPNKLSRVVIVLIAPDPTQLYQATFSCDPVSTSPST